ncbi:hypothetical protein CSKR_109338, partial [Clonorchis sinensis]
MTNAAITLKVFKPGFKLTSQMKGRQAFIFRRKYGMAEPNTVDNHLDSDSQRCLAGVDLAFRPVVSVIHWIATKNASLYWAKLGIKKLFQQSKFSHPFLINCYDAFAIRLTGFRLPLNDFVDAKLCSRASQTLVWFFGYSPSLNFTWMTFFQIQTSTNVEIQMRPTCVGGVVVTSSPRMSDVRGSNPGTATGYALLMSSNESETRVQCFPLV